MGCRNARNLKACFLFCTTGDSYFNFIPIIVIVTAGCGPNGSRGTGDVKLTVDVTPNIDVGKAEAVEELGLAKERLADAKKMLSNMVQDCAGEVKGLDGREKMRETNLKEQQLLIRRRKMTHHNQSSGGEKYPIFPLTGEISYTCFIEVCQRYF